MGKDTKRWGKMAAVSENTGFTVLQTRVYSLTAGSPTKEDWKTGELTIDWLPEEMRETP